MTLIVVNMSDETQTCTLNITGFAADGVEELLLLDQDHNAESALEQLTIDDMTLELPRQSAMLVILTQA